MLKKVTKRILKTILWIVVSLVIFDLLIVTLIIIPPVQQFVVLKASKILSNITGGEVTAEKIYLSPTLTLTATNFAIKDHHFENMIFASKLKGRINLNKSKNGQVCLSFAKLDDGEIVLRSYAGEENVNIAIWAKGFKKEKEKKSNFKLLFENIQLNNVRFVYINDDKRMYNNDNSIDYAFFELQHINLNVDHFLVFGPDISCHIKSLTLSQYTGFEITNFTGNFRIFSEGLLLDSLHFTTPNSMFNGDFAFRYNDWKDYADFVNLINFDTKINSASLSMKDVIYFAPALKGMENHFILSGYVGGVVNHLKTKDMYLKFKQQTYFSGDFALANILDFKNSSFEVVFKDANVNLLELEQFKLPGEKTIKLPETVKSLANARITGNYRGSFKNFNTNLTVKTNRGNLTVTLNTVPKDSALYYSGNIACNPIELGKITNQPNYLNELYFQSTLEGNAVFYENINEFFNSMTLRMQGKISQIDISGYSMQNIDFKGNYNHKKVNVVINSSDSIATFGFRGSLNFAHELPAIDAVLTRIDLKLHDLFAHYPNPIDTNNIKGFEKFILKMQQSPNFVFTMDSLEIDLSGNKFDNLNGYVGIDYAKLTDGNNTSRIDWLRLNAINKPNLTHQYLIHTNAVNVSFKTSYDFADCLVALSNVADYYLPDMFGVTSASDKIITSTHPEAFIDLDVQFFYTQNLFNLFLPRLSIARNTSANIHIGNTREEDFLTLAIPQISYNGLGRMNNLLLNGKLNENQLLKLKLQCDSVSMTQKKGGTLTFSDVDLSTMSNKKEIHFETAWRNPKMISVNKLNHLFGILFEDISQKPSLKITDSKLFLRESEWDFMGTHNTITYWDKNLLFNDCVLSSKLGTISINGEISKQQGKECNILLENFDISLINTLTEKLSMNFAGNMALMGAVSGMGDHYAIEGKSFVKEFVFNEEPLGDLFLDAVILEDGTPHFMGGILSNTKQTNINLSKFSYIDYLALPNRIIELTGRWDLKDKALRVHADIDTLRLGFLSPFLASFSNMVSGEASGNLNFVMNPDSLYFDGKVKIKNALLGIEPLNTVYSIINQEIIFNQKGIIFNDVLIKDKFKNEATLSGYVHHTKFKDFKIDLNIATQKILALNTPKKMDASFFGDGFVSGDISIKGDTQLLNFSSENIKTLPGSIITFPITSASTVSSSRGIYFVSSKDRKGNFESAKNIATALNFDFTFDITKDADVKLELDPIDGILKCKTTGKLHLLYNTKTDIMDLDGILSIASGKFHMSLKNFFPKDFTIVEGGTISFSGPLTSAQLNVSALYQKSVSLNSLIQGMGRTDVSAYLGLTGNLMNPNPTFNFAFPRLNDNEQFQVFDALDTANQQNGIRQFFSFVFLNTFIASESNVVSQGPAGNGFELVTGILNSFLSGQLKNVNIGVNYVNSQVNNEDKDINYKEYSVNAQINLYNDKLMLKTTLGLGYDDNESNKYGFVGDFMFNYPINDNWELNFFYFNDQTNIDMSKPQQGGGVGLKFRQEFNNKKDFAESWKIKKNKKIE